MVSSSSTAPEPSSRHHTYSRKQKSLGLLCSNFLTLYNRDGIEIIGLDDAAFRLGVERRRIYDIVNVLESVGVLARKAKNRYSWKGFGGIPKALYDLKEQGFKVNSSSQSGSDNHDPKILDYDLVDDDQLSNPSSGHKSSASSKNDNRREKSLGLLTQNFVKLFICSNAKLISLDDAAKLLLGDGHNTSIMRTKVRRLYDIANVLTSINLIEKTHTTDTRKPAFRWLGIGGKSEDGIAAVSAVNESRKRVFGTDLTNVSSKKSKVDSSNYEALKQDVKIQKQVKHESLVNELDRSSSEQDSKESTKTYHFGPFAPISVSKLHASENNVAKPVNNWDSLASTYRPQYHNQALKDLFGHYVEAWKSWYCEVGLKKPVQQFI